MSSNFDAECDTLIADAHRIQARKLCPFRAALLEACNDDEALFARVIANSFSKLEEARKSA